MSIDLQHKGYTGSYRYDSGSEIFHGEVKLATDVVTFQATKESELPEAFRDSVDDYLEMLTLDQDLRR